MKRLMAMLMATVLLFCAVPQQAHAAADYSWIKVKLSTNNATVLTMYASGKYFIRENGAEFTGGTVTVRSNGDGTMTLYHSGSQGEIYTGQSLSIMRERVSREAGYIKLNGRCYLGHFNLKVMSSGYIRVVNEVPLAHYLYGVVGYEMSNTFPIEALKAQAVAAHSYALYRRDHSTEENGAWFTADPARRQGCLTDAVLHSYWGTAYAANYARLSALVDAVQTQVLYYGDAPAGTSYFAMSNGRTEASENVWGSALPYLVSVDSSTDLSADNYQYTALFSAAQVQQAFSGLGITADLAAPESWFGPAELTAAGYAKALPVCGQIVSGTALRRVLGLRSTCFTVQYQSGNFSFTTRGYGHGVGLSQWGAKAMAEQGAGYADILAHYYPGTQLLR